MGHYVGMMDAVPSIPFSKNGGRNKCTTTTATTITTMTTTTTAIETTAAKDPTEFGVLLTCREK